MSPLFKSQEQHHPNEFILAMQRIYNAVITTDAAAAVEFGPGLLDNATQPSQIKYTSSPTAEFGPNLESNSTQPSQIKYTSNNPAMFERTYKLSPTVMDAASAQEQQRLAHIVELNQIAKMEAERGGYERTA